MVTTFKEVEEIFKAKSSNTIVFEGKVEGSPRKLRIVSGYDKDTSEYFIIGDANSITTTKTEILETIKKRMLEFGFKEKDITVSTPAPLEIPEITESVKINYVINIIGTNPEEYIFLERQALLKDILEKNKCIYFRNNSSNFSFLESYTPDLWGKTLDLIFDKDTFKKISEKVKIPMTKLKSVDWTIDEDNNEFYILADSNLGIEEDVLVEGFTTEYEKSTSGNDQREWLSCTYVFAQEVEDDILKSIDTLMEEYWNLVEYTFVAIETKTIEVGGEKFTKTQIHRGASFLSGDGTYEIGEGEKEEEFLLDFLETLGLNRNSPNLTLDIAEPQMEY